MPAACNVASPGTAYAAADTPVRAFSLQLRGELRPGRPGRACSL